MTAFNYGKLAWCVPYTALTGLLLAAIYGLALYPFNPALATWAEGIPGGWLLISATAGYWLPAFFRWHRPIRRPVLEEERRLQQAVQNIQRRMTTTTTYQLWLDESPGLAAFAIGRRTIVVSTALFRQFSPDELEAVIAHEIGHLSAKDTLIGAAYTGSVLVAEGMEWLARKSWQYAGRNTRQRLGCLFLIMVLVCWQTGWLGLSSLAALVLARWGFPLLNGLFRFIRMAESRRTEYRQDAFAQSLGYGPALKRALTKVLTKGSPGDISRYHLLFHGTHPITQHRIRRLEQLDGLRQPDGSLP